MFYVGIDIVKHNHEGSIIDSGSKLLTQSISFSNTQNGCDKLIKMLDTFTANS